MLPEPPLALRRRAIGCRFDDRFREFLNKQRHAVRLHDDPVKQPVGQIGPGRELLCHHGKFLALQPAQRQSGHSRMTGPRRDEFGPERHHQQDSKLTNSPDQFVQQLKHTWIRPVRVFEKDEQRPRCTNPLCPTYQGSKGAFPSASAGLRIQCRQSLDRQAKQGGDEGYVLIAGVSRFEAGVQFLCTVRCQSFHAKPTSCPIYRITGYRGEWVVCGEQNRRIRRIASLFSCFSSSASNRDLPIPASPEMRTSRPRPSRACCQRRRRRSSSSCHPIQRREPGRVERLKPAHAGMLAVQLEAPQPAPAIPSASPFPSSARRTTRPPGAVAASITMPPASARACATSRAISAFPRSPSAVGPHRHQRCPLRQPDRLRCRRVRWKPRPRSGSPRRLSLLPALRSACSASASLASGHPK